MAELVYAPFLNSGAHRACGFDSHLRYYSDGHYDRAGSTPALGTLVINIKINLW